MSVSDRSLLFRWPGLLLAVIASGACLLAVGNTLLHITGSEHPAATSEAEQMRLFHRIEARDARAAKLGIEAVLELDPAAGKLNARVFFDANLLPGELLLSLHRADGAEPPRLLRLQRQNAESYSASLAPLPDGIWLAELQGPDWQLKAELDVPRFAMVHIVP